MSSSENPFREEPAVHYKDDVRYGTAAEMIAEIDSLREMIGSLITEPRRSVKLISKKMDQFEPMTMTVTKGQVLAAIKMIKP